MPTIEVAVPFQDNWYFDAICDGIAAKAAGRGAKTAVFAATPGADGRERAAERFEAALSRDECVGAIAIGIEFRDPQVSRLAAHGKPVVAVGGLSSGLASVSADDEAVARRATEHLLQLGHVSIAHLAGYAISADDFSMRSDRVRGYSEAMRDAGLEASSHVVPCDFTYDAAYRAATRVLSASVRPTAIFAVADELAFAVLDAARALGLKVPQDLSVIGIDDHPESQGRGLTTWRQDPELIGAAAADLVFDALGEVHQIVEFALVPRASTARPGRRAPEQQLRQRLAALLRLR